MRIVKFLALFTSLIMIISFILNLSAFNIGFMTNKSSIIDEDEELTLSIDNYLNTDINLIPPFDDSNKLDPWIDAFSSLDQNENGISDQLDARLGNLAVESSYDYKFSPSNEIKKSIQNIEMEESERFTQDHIPIVAQFPAGDITSIINLFKVHGGEVNAIYDFAVNGFAGAISIEGLIEFSKELKSDETPFFIEEDQKFEACLYYASRNMNLRPYVWNTLSYTGDEYSSIAVIDSGIDDTHNFFTPGYGDADFTKKIVGWRDYVNFISTPYDDAGHGSHCAGITSGLGNPEKDLDGRTVSTFSFGLNGTGGYAFPQILELTAARFNVTDPGWVEVACEYEDFTPDLDYISTWAYLYHGETIVDSIKINGNYTEDLTYYATSGTLGDYSLRLRISIVDMDSNMIVYDPCFRFRGEIHWFFNPPLLGSGDEFKGIAPDTHLVGVKVLNAQGSGYESTIVSGLNWIISNKDTYNITVISMSLGSNSPNITAIINAVNNAVENGIVTVVAAGNSGSGGNNIGSPGDADNVITVAAMNYRDNVTDYSSQGGAFENTIKPDIMAPGGSTFDFTTFSADTNDNDANGVYTSDAFGNDTYPGYGTSMATPCVAGAANLLIEAMGGHENWNYSAIEAKRVKALLLMTATETYPLTRENNTQFSPMLDRGGKDAHEGYGRINIDAALEAYTQILPFQSIKSAWLTSSLINPFEKHALGCYVNLIGGTNYNFPLIVPTGADFDLYMYSNTPSSYGEPILVASSIKTGLGDDESISFTPTVSGKYYLVAKAISGEGFANISFLGNNFAPNLTDVNVNPSTGNQTTLFNFTVNYTDQDNNSPLEIDILINGTHYPMNRIDSSDLNFTDGVLYQYLIYLQEGTYNYSFECSDGVFTNSTITYSGLTISPIPNSYIPVLSDGVCVPESGSMRSTLFDFMVKYTDYDNDAPDYINVTINSYSYSMCKQDPLDSDFTDGCFYHYNTTLSIEGVYTYSFYCSDGSTVVNIGPYSGPTVKPVSLFDGMYVNHIFNYGSDNPSSFQYSKISDDYYGVIWDISYSSSSWDVNINTRLMSNAIGMSFGSNTHTPVWIFTNVALGDSVSIAIDGIGDHVFKVNSTKICNLPGYGYVELWELVDLTTPGSIAWYEASTGILINGTFKYNFYGYEYNYTFMFVSTNAIFNYIDNVFEPELTSESVSPLTGDQSTPFNFTVNYTDKDDDPPVSIDVLINGIPYSMNKVNESDFNYTDGCLYQYVMYLQPGSYYYSFYCSDGEFIDSTQTYTDLYVTETNDYAPALILGTVDPSGGNQSTELNFTVNYIDQDNNIPNTVNVLINGTPYFMNKVNESDFNYMDGCLYQYLIYLQPGNYNYSFYCSDNKFTNSTEVYEGLIIDLVNIYDPYLKNPRVTPEIGTQVTIFNFTVKYYDADNNFPDYINIMINSSAYLMKAGNFLDSNAMDGKLYYYNTTLDIGFYRFRIYCSDGSGINNTDWINAPEVNPLYQSTPFPLNPLSPASDSYIVSGHINFTWISMEFSIGSVNYTLQISSTLDFSIILYEQEDIEETPDFTSVIILLNLVEGKYYWRIRPTYGLFNGTWTVPSSFTIISQSSSPPTIPPQLIWLFIIIGLCSIIAVPITIIVIRKKRGISTKHKPVSKLKTQKTYQKPIEIDAQKGSESQGPLESSQLKPTTQEFTIELTGYYCPLCNKHVSIENSEDSELYRCHVCGRLLFRVIKCNNCSGFIFYEQINYLKDFNKVVSCPTCNKDFILRMNLKIVQDPEEEPVKIPEPEIVQDPEEEPVEIPEPEIVQDPEEEPVEIPEPEIVQDPEEEPVKIPELEIVQEYEEESVEIPKPEINQEEFKKVQIQTLDENVEKRIQAVKTLKKLPLDKSEKVLLSVLIYDKSSLVRAEAAIALGTLKIKNSIPILKSVAKNDEDPEVRRLAELAINEIQS
ncbi:MAG: hypothetical protein EAX96_04775 [Candidatus Lokiarchaeota archaeon]|nr:hypothetical protein [Candidatus Lokiarchaeota archaeon]